jgi:hypothetical protein
VSAPWRIGANDLRNLRGMIIDRDAAWRADPKWAPRIEAAIRDGIENIDSETFMHVHAYLRCSGLPGSYETYGFNDKEMAKAWRRYLKKHGLQSVNT